MEQQNIPTSKHLQTLETIEIVPNLGACYVIDNNPESKEGGFDVTSDEIAEDNIDRAIDSRSDNDNTKDRKINVTLDYKPEDDIKGGHSETLQNIHKARVKEESDLMPKNKLEDSIDGRCSSKLDGTSDEQHSMKKESNWTADDKPQDDLDSRFHDICPTDSTNNQSGYEGDVDAMKDGESSGNLTDSDSETKKNLAEKATSVIQKAIARLDSITEEVAEIVAEEKSNEEDSDEPGSSCTDTMVSEYGSTDLEEDTNIPRDILYKLLGKESKCNDRERRSSKNNKRKLSTDDG